jgi:type IV secretory pathway component VirB8
VRGGVVLELRNLELLLLNALFLIMARLVATVCATLLPSHPTRGYVQDLKASTFAAAVTSASKWNADMPWRTDAP